MATAFTHRLLVAIPAARQAAVSAFWTAQIDPGDNNLTWNVGLSADGNPPAVAYWASCALTDAQIVTIVRQLAQMASLPVPTVASLNTRQKVIDWITANRAALLAGTNIRIVRDDNEAANWTDPDDLLAAAGLQRIGSAAA